MNLTRKSLNYIMKQNPNVVLLDEAARAANGSQETQLASRQ
jgi:hypothetical protein